jgi:hypothetical protein
MPYQAAKKNNDKRLSTETYDQQPETDEQAAENTVQGADLLLSLTKGSTGSSNAMVTPQDPVGNNTSTGSLESRTSSCGSGMGPPIATTGIFPPSNHHPRLLYHSPIKISSSSASTSNEELRRPCNTDGISGELVPYAMVPAWSPSMYNGMVYPAYGRSPACTHNQQRCKLGPDEKNNGKRSAHDNEEKKQTEDDSPSTRKQRFISPSSSNEKTEEEARPDTLSSERKTSWNIHGPQRTIMYNMPPHWQHPPGYPPPPHMAYPHPLPHYPMYSPYPPPWGLYGPPPTHSPNILPPPVSFGKHQSSSREKSTKNTVMTRDDKPRHVSNESLPVDREERENASPCPTRNESLNRCIPLKHPIPKRSWS